MTVMLDNSKIYLRPMEGSEVVKEFWPRLQKDQLQAFVWRKGQSVPYQMKEAKHIADETITLEAPDFETKTMKSDFLQEVIFTKFRASDDLQYFAAGNLAWDEGLKRFTLVLKPPFFVTTKRATCRYISAPTDRISMNVAGHLFYCFDISSGGFSTEVQKDQYGGLTKGSVFEQVQLKYNLKSFVIPKVKLVNLIEMPGKGNQVRLAFKFEEVRPQMEDAIWIEVNKSIKKMVDLMG